MPKLFRRYSPVRAVVAAVAAYAFALQMLLGGIVATQMAAAGPAGEFVLCQGSRQPAARRRQGGSAVRSSDLRGLLAAFVGTAVAAIVRAGIRPA